jgi:hypothetical protein
LTALLKVVVLGSFPTATSQEALRLLSCNPLSVSWFFNGGNANFKLTRTSSGDQCQQANKAGPNTDAAKTSVAQLESPYNARN